MTCTNNQYKKFTIKKLLQTLEEIMAQNPNITLESELIISDINMGAFKQGIKVYPTKDYKDGQIKVGIYTNPYEKDELLEEPIQEVKKTTNKKPIETMVEEPIQETTIEEPTTIMHTKETPIGLSWVNKYL